MLSCYLCLFVACSRVCCFYGVMCVCTCVRVFFYGVRVLGYCVELLPVCVCVCVCV